MVCSEFQHQAIQLKSFLKSHWDDILVYLFTVVCVIFGDFILHKTRPELGWVEITAALISAVLLCIGVELMQGRTDTDSKRAAKKKNFPKRVLISGLAGLASQAIIPVMIKAVLSSIGIEL